MGLWAFSGTLTAGREKMDIVGCFIIAFCAGMGGATLRDVLLDRPVFWIVDGAYILTVAAVAFITFMAYPYIEPTLLSSMDLDRGRKRLLRIALEVPDALGMVLYSVYGAYVALHDRPTHGPHPGHLARAGGLLLPFSWTCSATCPRA